jgi:endonuclease/exonuclease/phosphatase family metal-dependent hydrolase
MKSLIVFGIAFLVLSASCTKRETKVTVMSFNIRLDMEADGENYWPFRKDFAMNMIRSYEVDVIGTQEVTQRQLNDLLEGLPQYAYAGLARDDGKSGGEYSAIFYKKEKYTLLGSNTFWLSEDPAAVGSRGWDAAYPRVVTWAILNDRTSGKEFAVLNTHFDHLGNVARVESAKLLLAETDKIAGDLPVIITGDFNTVPDSEPIRILTGRNRRNPLQDSRGLAEFTDGPEWTFHGFGKTRPEDRQIIDYVFVNKEVLVKKHTIIFETHNGLYLSDHNPVLVHCQIKD